MCEISKLIEKYLNETKDTVLKNFINYNCTMNYFVSIMQAQETDMQAIETLLKKTMSYLEGYYELYNIVYGESKYLKEWNDEK